MARSPRPADVAEHGPVMLPDHEAVTRQGELGPDAGDVADGDQGTQLGARIRPVVVGVLLLIYLAVRCVRRTAAGAVRWFRAGHLGGDGSVVLARWSGARR